MSAQARPQDYARAIYDLALEIWTRQLSAVQQALQANSALRSAIDDLATPIAEKLKLIDSATPGHVGGDVRRFLGTLLEAGHLDMLASILVEFEYLGRRRPERRLAQVTSAVPLTEAEQEVLRARLVNSFGSDLDFEFSVDESLLGGIRLRVGDQVIDGSVAGKLSALRDRLKET